MITLLHGSDIVSSRMTLGKLKLESKNAEVLIFDGQKMTFFHLKQAVETIPLLSEKKLIIIENLDLKKKKILEYLKKLSDECHLILWFDRELNPKVISHFGRAKIFHFKLPILIFKFLDSLLPENAPLSCRFLKELLRREAEEIVFFMLTRQIRLLLLAREGILRQSPQFQKMPPWQLSKLERQANFFSFDQLVPIYKDLLSIDLVHKTGQHGLTFKQELFSFLTNHNL